MSKVEISRDLSIKTVDALLDLAFLYQKSFGTGSEKYVRTINLADAHIEIRNEANALSKSTLQDNKNNV